MENEHVSVYGYIHYGQCDRNPASQASRGPPSGQIIIKDSLTVIELLNKLEKNNRVPKFTNSILLSEYSDTVFQIAKKALNKLGRLAPEGVRYLEGERYRLWQKGQIFTITAKNHRGEIMRLENDEVRGNLSSEDIKAFQIFEKELEKEFAEKSQPKPHH